MFERYTEKARRVIFFARYEASQFGSPYIETEHVLLGVLREDKGLTSRFLRSRAESIRKQIEANTTVREMISTSVDMPISDECKRVLAYAGEEAERLGHKHIGTEHLLLGLLREEKCFAAQILQECSVQLAAVREELARMPQPLASRGASESTPLAGLLKDLTQAASDGQLEPVVGRDLELDSVIEILGSRHKRNPVLIGERGTGKTAIVKGLAQRIADRRVPLFLAEKRILALESGLIAGWTKDRQRFEELTKSLNERMNPSETILFIDELQHLLTLQSGGTDGAGILRHALLNAGVQCIGALDVTGVGERAQIPPWLAEYSRTVHVRPLDEEGTLAVLMVRKSRIEKFHGVTYTQEALEFAAHSSDSYLPGRPLPGKAIELLDGAGSLVKLRQVAPPLEVTETQKRIKFVADRLETAVANHEFEKARFYSDEERKEREKLGVLNEKFHLDDSSFAVVGPDELKEVVSRWGAYPYSPSA
jgi:ATP-dependent Clp protease ATP-binding subunit ClpC